jgi:GDP-D-mannose dehydratase
LDVTFLNGDARLITAELGWQPTLSFKELVKRMVNFDIRQLIF